jgi:chloramphenicol-sensitive protein RarD
VKRGVLLALGAYAIWGLLPLYLHLLIGVAPGEVLAHRIVWSLATVALLLLALRRVDWMREVWRRPAAIGRFAITAALISANWLLYIWAVQNDHVVDSSLGYFINPLVSLVLGRVLLHERLRAGQVPPVALVVAGVAWLTWQSGGIPWIGLALALTFGLYGLLRKTASLGSIEGFAVEAAVLFPFAIGYFAWAHESGGTAFASAGAGFRMFLMLAGPLTTIPLLLFAAGARRIPLSTLGILQYSAPTMQWATGVFVFHESFSSQKAIGFGCIWVALALYAAESAYVGWQRSRTLELPRLRDRI